MRDPYRHSSPGTWRTTRSLRPDEPGSVVCPGLPVRIGGRGGVLRGRDGDDDEIRRRGAELLAGYRDGVLDRAAVADGDVLLDVGTGDGLIGFAALDRVGPRGRVLFSDISADLLAECRRRATEAGVLDRCRFPAGRGGRPARRSPTARSTW